MSRNDEPDLIQVLQHTGPHPHRPTLKAFLRSRFISANGVAAVLYLLLSLWIWRNPHRAATLWRWLQHGRR